MQGEGYLSMFDMLQKMFGLRGKTAIVTGGMGQLGSEYVKSLAYAGAAVAVFDVNPEVNLKLRDLRSDGCKVSFHRVDVTVKERIEEGMDEAASLYGTPTILINNAGIDAPPNASAADNGPFEDYPEQAWDTVMNSHLKGMFLVSQALIRMLKGKEKTGSIINISSVYGVVAPDQSVYDFRRKQGDDFYKPVAYSTAKAGVIGFTKWLAEYAAPIVRVNALVLGGVYKDQPEEFLVEYNRRTMLGRMADEDEYNAAVLFLASPASSYMTGSVMTIDGGWTAR